MAGVLAASAFWLSACGQVPEPAKTATPEPKVSVPVVAPVAAAQKITIHVPGMIDRQGIT
jgi:hypothetical protein